jgi:biopolymer transport protein ExbB
LLLDPKQTRYKKSTMKRLLPAAASLLLLPPHAHAQVPEDAQQVLASQTLWEMIMSVGVILVPLVALSLIVIGLIVFNLFWLRQSNIASREFVNHTSRLLDDRNLETVLDYCEQSKESAARVLAKLILFAKDNPTVDLDSLKAVAEAEGSRQAMRINQPNLLLLDAGAIAPMVGLLGTVVGILRSFGSIAADNTPMRTVILAGGVSQALVATAIGLSIGLTAMFFYSWFRTRIQGLVGHFEQAVTELTVKAFARLATGK